MYELKTTVRLHHTDAAGILFFAHQFALVHDTYESFLSDNNFGFANIFNEMALQIPIVRAESDYKAKLIVGDKLTIQMKTEQTGRSSFTLSYEIYKENNELAGKAKTVHVCVSKADDKPTGIPKQLRLVLEQNQ